MGGPHSRHPYREGVRVGQDGSLEPIQFQTMAQDTARHFLTRPPTHDLLPPPISLLRSRLHPQCSRLSRLGQGIIHSRGRAECRNGDDATHCLILVDLGIRWRYNADMNTLQDRYYNSMSSAMVDAKLSGRAFSWLSTGAVCQRWSADYAMLYCGRGHR